MLRVGGERSGRDLYCQLATVVEKRFAIMMSWMSIARGGWPARVESIVTDHDPRSRDTQIPLIFARNHTRADDWGLLYINIKKMHGLSFGSPCSRHYCRINAIVAQLRGEKANPQAKPTLHVSATPDTWLSLIFSMVWKEHSEIDFNVSENQLINISILNFRRQGWTGTKWHVSLKRKRKGGCSEGLRKARCAILRT